VRNLDHLRHHLRVPLLAHGQDRRALESGQPHVDRLRGADTARIAHHARGMHARPQQVGGVLADKIEQLGQFRLCFHDGAKLIKILNNLALRTN